jgi:hypothetical protein
VDYPSPEKIMKSKSRPTGMFGFTLVWLGQLISVLSTNMTAFALTLIASLIAAVVLGIGMLARCAARWWAAR